MSIFVDIARYFAFWHHQWIHTWYPLAIGSAFVMIIMMQVFTLAHLTGDVHRDYEEHHVIGYIKSVIDDLGWDIQERELDTAYLFLVYPIVTVIAVILYTLMAFCWPLFVPWTVSEVLAYRRRQRAAPTRRYR
jgi:hypothetical protein